MRLFLLFLLLPLCSLAQIEFSATKFDLGEVQSTTLRYVDCEVKNTGNQTHYILSVKTPPEVTYIHQGSLLQPGGSIMLRVQANPRIRGKFEYQVLVYTSNKQEPTVITIKGNVKSLPQRLDNNFTRCPAFGQKTPQTVAEETSFQMTVLVRDSLTKEPLAKSDVVLLQRGRTVAEDKTDKNGETVKSIPLGYTYFYAAHPGYAAKEFGEYVNFKRNYLIIELPRAEESTTPPVVEEKEPEIVVQPIPEEEEEIVEIVIEEEETIEITIEEMPDTPVEIAVEVPEETTEPIEEDVEEEETPTPPVIEEPEPQIVELKDLDSNDFSEEYFMPTNVVFVIDVSSSMRSHDKLELMKYSLYQLTDMLRPMDKIALISYSSNVEVLLQPTSGVFKDSIKNLVESMEASGYTSGGEAIKMGYKEALKSYIPDGNNQVIIITDGAFNRNSGDYKRTIRKYKRKGIHLSVVGIKNNPTARAEMIQASNMGDGTFVPINNLSDARNNLVQAIRFLSYRY